ncbi:hypothetical protein RJI07_01690 [Mycoplasmatota bacterium WC30]
MVKSDNCFKDLLQIYSFYLFKQIERSEFDIEHSFLNWDDISKDLKLYINAYNLTFKDNKILGVKECLERENYEKEFIENVLSKLSKLNEENI